MNQKQANRLIKLAQFLQKLDKQKWDYSSFECLNSINICEKITPSDNKINKVECGTTACALGWCTNVFPSKFKSGLAEKINEAIKFKDIDELKYLVGDKNFDLKIKSNTAGWVSGENDYSTFEETVCEFFGLTHDEMCQLFLGTDSSDVYGTSNYHKITSTMVANEIYKTVKKHGYEIVNV